MDMRWKRWAAASLALVVAYAVLGFWGVPWLLERESVSFARDRLHRSASVERISFNPFTLQLRASGVRLDEPQGSAIFGARSLALELQWRSLVTGAWHFGDIRIEEPLARLVVDREGRLNLVAIADALRDGQDSKAQSALPRLVIEKLAVQRGRVEFEDQRAGYAESLVPIDFELDEFSTLRDEGDTHTFVAKSKRGGTLKWKGQATMNPLHASGEVLLENVSLPELSVYLKSRARASIVAGKLSATVPYEFAYADGKLDAKIQGARLALREIAFAREGKSDAFASLSQLDASAVDADVVRHSVSIGDLRAEGGKMSVARDAKGRLDVAELLVATAGPAANPSRGVEVSVLDWSATIHRVLLDKMAVQVVDESTSPALRLGVGSLRFEASARASQKGDAFAAQVNDAALILADVTVGKGPGVPARVAQLGFEKASFDLAARSASLGRVFADGANISVVRDRTGAFDVASWLPASSNAPSAASPATASWKVSAGLLEARHVNADLSDEESGVKLHVADAQARIEGASSDLAKPVKFDASLALREGGQLSAAGTIVPKTAGVQAEVKAAKLELKALQPLLSQYLKLKIASGNFSTKGKLSTGPGTREKPALRYDGDFSVASLRLVELDDDLFGAWREVGAARLTLALKPNRVDIPELRIVGADAKLVIEDDRSFNAARLLVKPPSAQEEPVKAATDEEPFPVRVRRVRVQDGKLDFTDLSLRPQFAAKIQDLNGVVNGLSSFRTARSQVELDGRVDEFGQARIRGELNPFVPRDNTDINFVFRNVDMVPASPYSMKFAGYRIAEGKISLDLQYKVRAGQLEGDNKIVIDQLTLGEKVESPDALKIPLQLAIAILKDSDGRIDLGIPVSGDMNDPQFSYSSVIWRAVANIITKIVTAPFRALGSMLGVSGEKLEAIAFDPGSAKLQPPEREKLQQVAQILAKREGLRIAVPGQFSPVADGAALRTLAVREEVSKRAGIKLQPGEQPGPLDIADRAVRTALRELYAQRFGDAELDKAKKAAEEAAPAVATPAASASSVPSARALPIWQRVGKFIQGEPQVADPSAFYANLRGRLEREQALPPDSLSQLGAQRSKAIVDTLLQSGVATPRVAEDKPESIESPAGKPVPLKLGLAAR